MGLQYTTAHDVARTLRHPGTHTKPIGTARAILDYMLRRHATEVSPGKTFVRQSQIVVGYLA